MWRSVPVLLSLSLLSFVCPPGARADTPEQERDEGPRVATDGLYVGARGEPDVALLLGWDLDLYITGTRAVSMGPAISLALLGEEPSAEGRRQEYLVTLDFLRWKFQLNRVGSPVRWHVLVGGGMYWASLPEQQGPMHEIVLEGGTTTTAFLNYPYVEGLGAHFSVGLGVDVFVGPSFGVSVFTLGRVRLDDEMDRIPRVWAETGLGIRFGA